MTFQHLFLTLSLFVSTVSFSQSENQNIEWRALNYYLNKQYDEAIMECNNILSPEVHSNDLAYQRTQFILARTFMQTEQYEYALEVLRETDIDAEFFGMGIEGMMGDCRVQQKKYGAALHHYKKAIQADANDALTPNYLFKAYLCSKELNNPTDANRYIQTILSYFPAYAGKHSIEKYLTIDTIKPLSLNFPEAMQPMELGIGTINGIHISQSAYFEALQTARENAFLQAQYSGQEPQYVDPNRVWKAFVEEETLKREYKRLNLQTDEEEMMAYLLATDGYSVQAEFLYSFTNDDGSFAPNKLLARINDMRYAEEEYARQAWKGTEEYYRNKLLQERYFNFLGLIPFATNLEIQLEQEENKSYKAHIVVERFKDVSNDEITITNEELKKYYEENKLQVKYRIKEDQREIIFIRKDIAPTAADTLQAYKKAKDLKKMFHKAKDDSAFVIAHSDFPFYTRGPFSTAIPQNHAKGSTGMFLNYPNSVSREMESGKIGDIVGPYLYNNSLAVSKIIGKTDDVINARHILLQVHGEPDDPTYEEAYEFFKTVTNENFDELARLHSEDLGSVDKGGDLGNFFFGDMVPQFATFCADAPVGEIGFVQTQFGYHVVQVTKRSGKRFPRLAMVTLPIEQSEESYSIPKKQLEEFRTLFEHEEGKSNAISQYKKTDSLAQIFNLTPRNELIRDDAPRLFGFNTLRAKDDAYRFMYDTTHSIGSVSLVYRDSLSYYLMIHGGTQKKGIPNFDFVRDVMHADLSKIKKSELLKKRIESYSPSRKEKLQSEVEISLSYTSIPYCGYEPNVVGKAIDAFQEGKQSIIVEGYSGVYYVHVTEEISDSDIPNKELLSEKINATSREDLILFARSALTKINNVIDNRTLYRLHIRK